MASPSSPTFSDLLAELRHAVYTHYASSLFIDINLAAPVITTGGLFAINDRYFRY